MILHFLLVCLVIILMGIVILFSFIPVGLWISALAAGVKVGIFTLIGMFKESSAS